MKNKFIDKIEHEYVLSKVREIIEKRAFIETDYANRIVSVEDLLKELS